MVVQIVGASMALLAVGGIAFFGVILLRIHRYGGGMAIIYPPMYDRKEKG